MAVNGPTTVNAGQTNVMYALPFVVGAVYNWATGYLVLSPPNNTTYSAQFNVPSNSSGNSDTISCQVMLNGVSNTYFKNVYIS